MKYEEPRFYVLNFATSDIIRTSGEGDDLTNEGNIPDYGFSTTP